MATMAEQGERMQRLEAQVEAMQQWAINQNQMHGNGGPTSLVKPPKPELYNGGPNPDLWIFSLHVYFIAVNMQNDAQRIAFATALLRGAAMDWWRYTLLHHVPATWDDFSRALIAQFMPIAAERLARDQLARLRQGDGPVRKYIFEFRRLLLRVTDLTPADALHRFVQGLKPALAREVNIRDPPDLDTAMSIAQRADIFNYRAHVAATLTSQRVAGGGPTAMELGMIDGPVPRRFEGYCRGCGKWGHRAAECRKSKYSNSRAAKASSDTKGSSSYTKAAQANAASRSR